MKSCSKLFLARLNSLILLLFLAGAGPGLRAASVSDLRCEYLQDPVGIDATSPRLSWVIASSKRGDVQTAYQVLVASSIRKLKANEGDLWDTGKVLSEQSIQLPYAGKTLASRQPCFWKVRVWDRDGKVSGWSVPASWSMGLLEASDWQAQWIGKDETQLASRLTDCSWIWFPDAAPTGSFPPGTRYFRRHFELPADKPVARALLLMAGDDEYAFAVNAEHAMAGSGFRTANTADITRLLKPGKNVVAGWVKNHLENPNPAGLCGQIKITFDDGSSQILPSDEQWLTHDRESGAWTALAFDDAQWKAARVLGPVGMAPWGEVVSSESRGLAARMLRQEFRAKQKPVRATAYFIGLGSSELLINGEKVGDHVLSPGLTEYGKRLFYVTHDVTRLVEAGENAVGLWLGNGRFFPPRPAAEGTPTHGVPRALLQLELEYADGSRQTVVSDASWKVTDDGPITANNEFDGEDYDARKEMPGWARPGFNDTAWETAAVLPTPGGELTAQMMEPIRVTGTVKPVAVTEPQPGMLIYDLGQNLVGWCRIAVRGPAGTRVTLRHAERLKPDGTLYMDNLRSARVTDNFVLKGDGTEIYEPRFTYHGFRYVEVTGLPGRSALRSIEGRVVNDDLPLAGAFECSHTLINQIYQNVVWGVRGNYRSIPTDCPQRDERQGWLGDRSAEALGETYLFQVAPLYSKWLQDMADGQRDNGSISDVCPTYWALFSDNVTWPASSVIIPGTILDQYGDTRLIERHYPTMVKWIDHMSTYVTNGIIARDNYGDWCVPPEDPQLIHSKDPARKTAPAILATTYFHHCLKLMGRYAHRLGKTTDEQRFQQLAATLKTALNRDFYHHDRGHYDNGSQTSCVLPLAFDMVPDTERVRVFERLVDKIENETKGHIGTGLIGGQWLNQLLTRNGRIDLAYTFATNRTYPSWGYMVEQGATTIWELWNGDTADPAMNSGNHVMLVGDLITWLYQDLAGIKSDPKIPGFKRLVMEPKMPGDLAWVKASHRSPYGLVASEWKRTGSRLTWAVTIPPNTSALLALPAPDVTVIKESGKPAAAQPGLRYVDAREGKVWFEAGSGTYKFAVE